MPRSERSARPAETYGASNADRSFAAIQPNPFDLSGDVLNVGRWDADPFRRKESSLGVENPDSLKNMEPPNSGELQHQSPKDMTVADSGYHSGLPTDCNTLHGQAFVDDDCASIGTDGWSSALPSSDKRLLETQFARGMFNSMSAKALERLSTSKDTIIDLIYCFAAMIGKRAKSSTEKGAASFVRHGRT